MHLNGSASRSVLKKNNVSVSCRRRTTATATTLVMLSVFSSLSQQLTSAARPPTRRCPMTPSCPWRRQTRVKRRCLPPAAPERRTPLPRLKVNRADSQLVTGVQYRADLADFHDLYFSSDEKLFNKILTCPNHILWTLLPPPTAQNYSLRNRPHNRQLPDRISRITDCNFTVRMLYRNMY